MNEYRVLVAEPDFATAAMLVAQVEQLGHTVIGEVKEPSALLALARQKQPDAVIVPWRQCDATGPDTTIQDLTRTFPSLHVVARVNQQSASDRYEAMAAGAWACIPFLPSTMELMAAFEQDHQPQARPAAADVAPDMTQNAHPLHEWQPATAPAPIVGDRQLGTAGKSMLKRVIS